VLVPKTYNQAITSDDVQNWMFAMHQEHESLVQNETYVLVERPPNRKILDSQWIYTIKDMNHGQDQFKARLVVGGHRQIEGIDYFETFASVARQGSVRLLLSIAAMRKYEIMQFDVKTAFLYGKLDEEIYMKQPKGFEVQ